MSGGTTIRFHGDRWARRAAAVYVYYRLTSAEAWQSAPASKRSSTFPFELLGPDLSLKFTVPSRFILSMLSRALFHGGDLWAKTKELGVLIDVSFLESSRLIQILSTNAKQRAAMADWILCVAESSAIIEEAPPSAPARIATPPPPVPLSELLAERTIRTLVDELGLDARHAHHAVSTLSDKGDVEAAVAMAFTMSTGEAEQSAEVDSDSEASTLSSCVQGLPSPLPALPTSPTTLPAVTDGAVSERWPSLPSSQGRGIPCAWASGRAKGEAATSASLHVDKPPPKTSPGRSLLIDEDVFTCPITSECSTREDHAACAPSAHVPLR